MESKKAQIEEDENFSPEIEQLLENNAVYVEETNREFPEFFKTLGSFHKPKYLMIGCADARIHPNTLLKINPGELFIHRNIANQVFQGDLNCNSIVQYAVEGLGIKDIIIMGHSMCGGVMASMTQIPFQMVDQWIAGVREIYDTHQEFFSKLKTDEDKANALSKINVRHQCLNLKKSAALRRAKDQGKTIRVHGFFLNVRTGVVEDLKFNNAYKQDMQKIYSDILMKLSTVDGEGITTEDAPRTPSNRNSNEFHFHVPHVNRKTGLFESEDHN